MADREEKREGAVKPLSRQELPIEQNVNPTPFTQWISRDQKLMTTFRTYEVSYSVEGKEAGKDLYLFASHSHMEHSRLKTFSVYWRDPDTATNYHTWWKNTAQETYYQWREVPKKSDEKYPNDFTELEKAKMLAREHCQLLGEGREVEQQKQGQSQSR